MNRIFAIAIIFSIGVHLFFMTGVVIINPAAAEKIQPYARIEFLGPLLKKTAFDIMLGNSDPSAAGNNMRMPFSEEKEALRTKRLERKTMTTVSDKITVIGDVKGRISNFLSEKKNMPDTLLYGKNEINLPAVKAERRVIYRPETPTLMKGLYGPEHVYTVKVTASVSPDGKVKSAEPATTTGSPQVDMTAAKYVKGWIFEPGIPGEDVSMSVEVELRTEK